MPLIVQTEDGNVANANSYVSLAFFKSYTTDYGYDISSYTDTQLEQALARARLYIDTRFNYLGTRVLGRDVQVTEFPRIRPYTRGLLRDISSSRGRDSDYQALPLEIQQAQCQYALIALTSDLYPTQDDSQVGLKRYAVKVGSVSESKEFFSPTFLAKAYLQADNLVRESKWVTSEARISWSF